jgi:CBS domain-containing protein
VTLERVEAVPSGDRPRTPVGQVMRTPAVLSPEDLVSDALRTLDREGAHQLAVAEGGVLVGTLSRQEIHRGLQLRELEASQHPRAGSDRRGRAAG